MNNVISGGRLCVFIQSVIRIFSILESLKEGQLQRTTLTINAWLMKTQLV